MSGLWRTWVDRSAKWENIMVFRERWNDGSNNKRQHKSEQGQTVPEYSKLKWRTPNSRGYLCCHLENLTGEDVGLSIDDCLTSASSTNSMHTYMYSDTGALEMVWVGG